jgi:hypothetical protein
VKVLVCIDDTDNAYSKGTGKLTAEIIEKIEERKWGKCFRITRHQLFVHPDIPYTSHNSAMCFAAELDKSHINDLTGYVSRYLAGHSAEGSDPGLCIAVPDRLSNPDLLIKFGFRAKEMVMEKKDAYLLAGKLGIHLSEHGGTGQGVIGALAGAGLRLGGNDGRFRGRLKIEAPNNLISVHDILTRPDVDLVRSLQGSVLDNDELIRLGEKVKTVLSKGKSILPVHPVGTGAPGEVRWETCTKEQLKIF